MFTQENVIGWLGKLAVVDDHKGGYWLVDWGDSEKRIHISAKEMGVSL